MCNPLAMTIVSGVLGTVGAITQSSAAASAANANAAASEQNARLAALQGEDATRRGAMEEARLRARGAQIAGRQSAMIGASGLTTGGSFADIAADTAMGIELDANALRYSTAKEKWGFDVQATDFMNQASQSRAQAKNARRMGLFGAASSIIGAAGTYVSGLPTYQSTGSSVVNGSIQIGGQGLVDPNYAKYGYKSLL